LQQFRFSFESSDLDLFSFGDTKCGFRQWPKLDPIAVDDYTTVKFNDHPSKKQAQMVMLREMIEAYIIAIEETREGLVPYEKRIKAFITTMSIKEQNLSAIDIDKLDKDSVKEMYLKSRLFFLSNDSMLHKFFLTRIKGERTYFPDCMSIYGDKSARNQTVNISIGFTWTKGGAYMLYNAMLGERSNQWKRVSLPGDSADNVCCTWEQTSYGTQMVASGDIKSLDTSITAIPLVLYMMFAQMWIQRDDADPHYRAFQYILESCAEQLAGKTVRWIKDYMLLIGVMPSGSLETSHGDSWIVGIVYWLSYVFSVMSMVDVQIRKIIWRMLAYRLIAIFVYGDDFLKTYPRAIRDYINVDGFAAYMLASHGIQMKNKAEFGSLLTRLRVVNNEVLSRVYTGPSYLKRFLIESSNFNLEMQCPKIATVVSWRPLQQYEWRAGVPRDRSAPIYLNLSRLIGLAYDTLGVDPISYYYLYFLYKRSYEISSQLVGENYLQSNIPKWLEQDVKYLRKINFKLEHFGFPSRDYLLGLNVVDRNYHYPKNVGTWQDHLRDYEYW